jgi:hypothetical protein
MSLEANSPPVKPYENSLLDALKTYMTVERENSKMLPKSLTL